MTDREKLYKLIDSFEVLGVPTIGFRHHFADYLIANGVVVREWIPVTERLPETEGSYLVYTERGSVYASHFYTEKKFASGYVREASWSQRGKVKVTHWMPLPEPPKEGE